MKPEPFTVVTGIAAPMPEDNIDTDIIFPARFLLLTTREGLGEHAFADRRRRGDGSLVADYVLNRPEFAGPRVIVAGDNFGSGSSREQAVWALLDLGVRVVIAGSFGEIFHNNCLRNGILPIVVDAPVRERLLAKAEAGAPFTADLAKQTLTVPGEEPIAFAIEGARKDAMLNGWDETDQVVARFGTDIAAFERAQAQRQPWLYPKGIPA